jgi:enhancer of polycomb-like protein
MQSVPLKWKAAGQRTSRLILWVGISLDEFELVMGLYKKVSQEKVLYLCHHAMAHRIHQHSQGFKPSMPLPFSEFYKTFSMPLQPHLFATFAVPTWVPSPDRLLHIARSIYPYWRWHRMERVGHHISSKLCEC